MKLKEINTALGKYRTDYFSVSEMIEKYQEAVCPSCRSQIEAETRQKCWNDLLDDWEDLIVQFEELNWQELKKKWRISK